MQPRLRPAVESFECRRLMSFTPFGGNAVVPGGFTLNFDTAVAPDGSFYVAVEANRRSPSLNRFVTSILVSHYGANGRQVGDTITLSNYVTGGSKVSIAADAIGGAVVVFGETRGTNRTLQFDRISGEAVTDRMRFVTQANRYRAPRLPTVAMDNQGGFFVGWVDNGSVAEGFSDQLMIRHFGASASGSSAAFVAETPSDADFNRIDSFALTADTHGGALYAIGATSTAVNNVRYGFVNDTSRLSHATIGDAASGVGNPAVAVNADGSFEIGYSNPATPQPSTAVRRYSSDGTLLSTQNTGNKTNEIALAALPGGGFAAAAITNQRGRQTMTVTRYNADGGTDESGPTAIATGEPIFPVLGADSAGNVVAAYSELGKATGNAVHYQRFTPGVAVDGSTLYLVGTNGNDVINTTLQGTRVVADVNGTTQSFRRTKITSVSIDGLGGDDQLNNATNLPATINGGAGSDIIQGGVDPQTTGLTVFGEQLIGGDGNDTIFGSEGNDRIAGSDGDDRIGGNYGDDRISGGNGRDTIDGNAGDDRISGDSGSDQLGGEDGNDRISGGNGDDRIYGGFGNDTLIGGLGKDRIFGEEGRDTAAKDDQDSIFMVETLI